MEWIGSDGSAVRDSRTSLQWRPDQLPSKSIPSATDRQRGQPDVMSSIFYTVEPRLWHAPLTWQLICKMCQAHEASSLGGILKNARNQ